MTAAVLRVGTRGSALALAQSGWVGAAVTAGAGGTVELVRIRTEGDVNLGPLAEIGGTGVFVTAIRAALLAGDVDVIVHSFKDLPTAPAHGIRLAAVPVREDPADALCARDGRTLADLPPGARIGTGAPRRAAQLLALRPDLQVEPVRGNVDTRLGRVASGDLDAVVLAVAGLRRLGRVAAITQVFTAPEMLPAPAQGALAVECRSDGTGWYDTALGAIDDRPSRWAALAERAVLTGLEAGCSAPIGAKATVARGELTVLARVIAVDGSASISATRSGQVFDDRSAQIIGQDVATELLAAGAPNLLGAR